MRIQGTFIKISNFKQLIIVIDKETHEQMKLAIPSITWVGTNLNPNYPGTKYFAKITLDKYDKAAIATKFEPHVGKKCVLSCQTKSFQVDENTIKYVQLITANFLKKEIASPVEKDLESV